MALYRHPFRGFFTSMTVLAGIAAAAAFARPALAEAPECLSFDPAVWPAPARPYFMVIVDTSGSMVACTNPVVQYPGTCPTSNVTSPPNSCGLKPTRINDAKCAMRKTIQSFAGEVNFGLATYAGWISGCPAGACGLQCPPGSADCTGTNGDSYVGCTWNGAPTPADAVNLNCGNFPNCTTGSGVGPALPNLAENTWRNGGRILVGLDKDAWWTGNQTTSNVTELLKYFDGQCGDSKELPARNATPIAGSLRTVTEYLRSGWNPAWSNANYCATGFTTPLGTPADANDRACRSLNVILVTDGDESCDTGNQPAVDAATDLWQNGVTLGGKNWKVPTYVINFAGGTVANTNAIAAAGGTTTSITVNNEVQLASALANIVANAAKPEVCNNGDDNCNGCTDEGYKHYCDTGQTCCAWATPAQRTTCLNNYTASITPANPNGNVALLPCTTAAQQADPVNWLCYNPGDICDNADNNCQDGIDENQTKCGTPSHCPLTETCNGQDDDCDGLTDEGVCPGCVPSPEVCDGCDNDCDGVADDGVAAQPCGFPTPANCLGTQACKPAQPVGTPGACVAGGGFQACANNPQTEVCDGIDNNCNGIPDDGVAPTPCVPAGTPGGLVYGGNSQCKMGQKACGSMACIGFVGPSAEVCDGIDNDCDGVVDDSPVGAGAACGPNKPPCTPGTLACVNGALVCQGGVGPQPEVCDNIDNNCNGTVDEAPLADGPLAGQNGCWQNAGNCCTFKNLNWCPPPGATCTGNGTLTAPCSKGTLVCSMGAWQCQGPVGPSAEQCDSADNNCDGIIDNVGQVGQPCGTDVGECVAGVYQCSPNGIQCVGQVGPSTEICDGKDNDCDGQTDEGVAGLGKPCGINQPPCTLGSTACVNGAIVCQGAVNAQPEKCDGIDNDCDGKIDDAPLVDAPPAGNNGCWDQPGNCCSFGTPPLVLQWCPPPGASCNGNGMLSPPCNKGTLACQGALGWMCTNANSPVAEACDGLDNDCDGNVDNGMFPGEGQVCGSNVGECKTGLIDCSAGILDCVGDVPPSQEVCDGKDNDCDGTIDNGIVVGGPCAPLYDTMLYPGPRDKGQCQPGVLGCDGMGGQTCTGGVGPSPEICDGVDNDCDGQVDEAGPAPDGVDGTENPDPTKVEHIGDACGIDTGACEQGQFVCLNGLFACQGETKPSSEGCDCNDNDCDGTTDEQDPNSPPLCAPGASCVKSGNACSCATPCAPGEFPCPPGQICQQVNSSETGVPLGAFCIADNCGDCAKKTVKDASGKVLCAPAGTPADANCVVPPVCVCKGLSGCKDPCDGVTCGAGEICAAYGPDAGKCVPNNCYNAPCQGCDKLCNAGSCIDNPCVPFPADCKPGQVCKPDMNGTTHQCLESCAGKTCNAGEICHDGNCVVDCPPCQAGWVCDYSQMPAACVPSLTCNPACGTGQCCDPKTGQCGDCPCNGVVCPNGQTCDPKTGECTQGGQGGMGGMGGMGGGMASSSSSSTTSSGIGGQGGEGGPGGIWGLPTGGGGCSCDVGARNNDGFVWALAALVFGVARKRSSQRRGGKEVSR